jgi:tRNA dimethylallyltransferase
LCGRLTVQGSAGENPPVRKVHFILGCTASGKGAVGRELARRFGGQVVSVDSMKVYRRMDIGTAKPSREVRTQIPHHCIDVVEPSESFSVAQYLACADRAVEAIAAAGRVALAVGGSSLYVKALREGLFEGPAGDAAIRADLRAKAAAEGLAALHAELAGVDPEAAGRIHRNDERRIIRALEVYRATGQPISGLQRQWDGAAGRYECVLIGLRREKAELSRRINLRVKRMMERGLRDEAAGLLAEPAGLSVQARQAVGYAEMIEHLAGRLSLEDCVERIKINTRRLAKKQRTWQRTWRDVQWFDLADDEPAERTAERILAAVKFSPA